MKQDEQQSCVPAALGRSLRTGNNVSLLRAMLLQPPRQGARLRACSSLPDGLLRTCLPSSWLPAPCALCTILVCRPALLTANCHCGAAVPLMYDELCGLQAVFRARKQPAGVAFSGVGAAAARGGSRSPGQIRHAAPRLRPSLRAFALAANVAANVAAKRAEHRGQPNLRVSSARAAPLFTAVA